MRALTFAFQDITTFSDLPASACISNLLAFCAAFQALPSLYELFLRGIALVIPGL